MTFIKLIAATTVSMGVVCGTAAAQPLPDGRIYAFHSGPQGGCPGLDWHVVANGGALEGMIAWNNMQSMARATGTANIQAKTFQMTAKEVGGKGRTATISGSIDPSGYLIANIKGPDVNCQRVAVRWFVAPSEGGRG